ncbi:two-component system sensor histidine kinase NtrB [Pseudemcibacter aquimaris]|uniref:two-component system sensor histidine kinase NtrB n=1 Tax=Pseudemcibacter aquimaris TaxID=2857064 RepID=UPI0020131C54|nr:ATP-binding protein [Pseudemcibacter aquimaris]MCC3860929.1 PAS domain-containing protein [Pseudemcibacter aquimaris]WDU59748.1 PAS domain-containing protein [Pseudemcibacter aquimaris]
MEQADLGNITDQQSGSDYEAILNSLPDAILTLSSEGEIVYANAAAEILLGSSLRILTRKKISDIVPDDSPVLTLVSQSFEKHAVVSEYDVNIGNPLSGEVKVDVHVAPQLNDIGTQVNNVILQFQQRTIAQKISQQKQHRNAARSVSGMAAMLAHEIKNPLSGIKGSAQILSHEVSEEDKALTDLIVDEVDRICALVDRMEIFTDSRQIDREEINIHSILEHVRRLAENGFGKHVKFMEHYDPSLPATMGDRGRLIQVFLNIVKNACEAVTHDDGQVTFTTAYKQGMRVATGTDEYLNLPLEICIIDNGGGIANEIKEDIFDPFVTTKTGGTGLGLAMVAKIIADHGGIIECDTSEGKTIFRILLPAGRG